MDPSTTTQAVPNIMPVKVVFRLMQAAGLFALLTSLSAPIPEHFDQYTYEGVGRASDADALDLLNPSAAPDIARALCLMGIKCDEVCTCRSAHDASN